jgi:AcrR family transcriptional regulator
MPKAVDEARIFDAALDLLVLHGYEGATTREIADRAGVNEVTLFRRYGSKAALFERAIDHRLSDTPLNRLSFSGDLEADLVAIVDAYLETNETSGDVVSILLIEMPRNPDLQGSFATPWRNLQSIMHIIQAYQTRGMLVQEPPVMGLIALLGPVAFYQMFRRANPELAGPAIDPLNHVASFLHGRKT